MSVTKPLDTLFAEALQRTFMEAVEEVCADLVAKHSPGNPEALKKRLIVYDSPSWRVKPPIVSRRIVAFDDRVMATITMTNVQDSFRLEVERRE